jgi:cell division protein FtsB
LLGLLRIFSPGRFILVVTLVATGYLLLTAGNNFLHSYRLTTDEERLRHELGQLEQQRDQLLQVRDYLRTDEYVEFMARRVFGLVKPGENLVIVQAPEPPPSGEEQPGTPWWQRLFGR